MDAVKGREPMSGMGVPFLDDGRVAGSRAEPPAGQDVETKVKCKRSCGTVFHQNNTVDG